MSDGGGLQLWITPDGAKRWRLGYRFGGAQKALALRVYPELELLAPTFVRTGELRAAEWAEFDLDATVWEIPAGRMKMRKPHRVPLAPRAVETQRGFAANGLHQRRHDEPRLPRLGFVNAQRKRALESGRH